MNLYTDVYYLHLDCIFAVEYLSNLIIGMLTTSQHTSKVLKRYSTRMFPQLFEIVRYTMWRAFPIMYVNSVSTLLYTFGDQLIIMISLALRNYFIMFNKDAFAVQGKVGRYLFLI